MSHYHHNGSLSGGITLLLVGAAILATTIFGIEASAVWKGFGGALLIALGLIKIFNLDWQN